METNIIEQNGKRYRVTIVEEVEVETVEDYLKGHKASGLKVGDKVRVLRKAENFEGGWNGTWFPDKTQCIGKEYEIKEDNNGSGFAFYGWHFPYFVLEKVEKEVKSYKDVVEEIKPLWYTDHNGITQVSSQYGFNTFPSKEKAHQFTAKLMLDNVATYLNEIEFKDEDWETSYGYYISFDGLDERVNFQILHHWRHLGLVTFKSEQAAQRAIEILGEETIKMALK